MSTIYEQRVKRLRERVLASQAKRENKNAVENTEQVEVVNYDKLKVPELKELLDKKGIEYNAKALRDELIELLEGAE